MKRESESRPELKSLTVEELINKIETSELNFKNREFKSQNDLEKISANW